MGGGCQAPYSGGSVADYTHLLDRIATLRERSRTAAVGAEEMLVEIEAVLCDGYAEALAGEGRLVRLEERLDEILDRGDESRARELRVIVRDHRDVEAAVLRLRSALAGMHDEFVALGGARTVR
jgi:hypothetical protein